MANPSVYIETLAMLRKELASLRDREQQIEAAIDVVQRLVPAEGRRRHRDLTPSNVIGVHGRNGLAGMTMIQAAETVLREAGHPMHVMDIAEEMLARGFPYDKDKNALRASLTGSMERKDTFRWEAPARYGLSIWAKSQKSESESKAGAAE
jgi:HB1/ASXL restriction endonuclease-like protein with HTH domain